MKNLFKSQRGSTIVIFSLLAVIIIGFTSLVTDIGMVAVYKAKLTHAVDSAALAGAQELIYNDYPVHIKVDEYLSENGFPDHSAEIDTDSNSVRVTAFHRVEYKLARLLGYTSKEIHATAKAKVLPVIGVNQGIRPFAIEAFDFEFGETYVLKQGGGSGNSGNYGAVELGGRGAQIYFQNIVEGYNDRLMVGDYINTEPGNMSGPTENGINHLISQCNHIPKCTHSSFDPDCPRIITVIIVDNMNVNGRSSVQIIGFASFFLEGVAGSGNKSEVTGRFIRTVTSGENGDFNQDFGLYGVKLVE
ncbi:MAG: hypothetical protein GX957_14400 [Clostridiaceae bacterium]|nr:hypothetical protein [Clostridiaceae bacterium]